MIGNNVHSGEPPSGSVTAESSSYVDLDLPVGSATLRPQVVVILTHATYFGKLRPGELLTELPLAKKLSISQSTIRQALTDLEHYGLVTRVPNRGTVVTTISTADVQHRM